MCVCDCRHVTPILCPSPGRRAPVVRAAPLRCHTAPQQAVCALDWLVRCGADLSLRRLILQNLIPVRMLLGTLPAPALLRSYDLEEVRTLSCPACFHIRVLTVWFQFTDLVLAVRTGDLKLFRDVRRTAWEVASVCVMVSVRSCVPDRGYEPCLLHSPWGVPSCGEAGVVGVPDVCEARVRHGWLRMWYLEVHV